MSKITQKKIEKDFKWAQENCREIVTNLFNFNELIKNKKGKKDIDISKLEDALSKNNKLSMVTMFQLLYLHLHALKVNSEEEISVHGVTIDQFNSRLENLENMYEDMEENSYQIADKFFSLGLLVGKSASHELFQLFLKNQQRAINAGAKSSPWVKHSEIIYKHLDLYYLRKYKTQLQAIDEIEKEIATGETISPKTFQLWWKKYENGKPVFLANPQPKLKTPKR